MPALTLEIRAATPADLDQILMFINEKAAFDGCPNTVQASREKLAKTLFTPSPSAEVAFAEVEKKIVGFVLFFQTYSSFLAQPTMWMDDLFVQPGMRGQGIGKALINYVAQQAKQRNCGRLEWTVATSNDRAIEFYKSQGAQIQEAVRLCRLSL
uniref:GCN5-related N-acetyltransferase n=1 Tax=Cyanothece sp. (strain PCC 7425 / ATCC 29141) TaxID=395961 RepID=B8HL92_CYAP4